MLSNGAKLVGVAPWMLEALLRRILHRGYLHALAGLASCWLSWLGCRSRVLLLSLFDRCQNTVGGFLGVNGDVCSGFAFAAGHAFIG